jgi:hypothetical protein
MDAVTEGLLRDLASSPTDLRKLVISTLWYDRTAIAIQADAVARWERDDPKRWGAVREWLLSRGVTITVLKSLATAPTPRAPQPAPAPPPEPPAAGLRG